VKTGENEYTVMANITWQYLALMDNAKREDTRKRFFDPPNAIWRATRTSRCCKRFLVLRDNIARKLGYKTYADYETETKMVKTATRAIDFEEKLETGLRPKMGAEVGRVSQNEGEGNRRCERQNLYLGLALFRQPVEEGKIQCGRRTIARVFSRTKHVVDGMFAIYQRIFGLKFERVEPPYKWIDDLQLYSVSDAKTGEPLGLFYLDMFPREGKYHHFAQFGIIEGKLLPDGRYQRPVCALICNFPTPTKDHPSLMTHDDVETIFHEFGHAMHHHPDAREILALLRHQRAA